MLSHKIAISNLEMKTFGELALFWIFSYAKSRKAPSSLARDHGILKNYLVPTFGNIPLHEIKAVNVEVWFYSLRDRFFISQKSCNDILGLFKKILNDAVRWGFVDKNPVLLVQKFQVSQKDISFWTASEAKKFLNHWSSSAFWPRIFIPCVLALYTGMRRGEVLALKWSSVDLVSEFITVKQSYCKASKKILETTKSKKIRYIPISKALLTYLKDFKPVTFKSGYVSLIFNPDCFRKEFIRACKQAGVKVIRFHDLRHTFASNFLMGGGNIYDLQKILGHSTIQVTERYAHLAPGHLQGKTEILGF